MKPAYEEFIDTYEIPPLLYSFVGTKWFASVDDIKKAYKKNVKKYHPDVNEEHKDGIMIRMVNASYEILIDPQKKAEYDAFLGSDEFWNRFGKILGRTGKKGDSGEGKAIHPPPRTENNSAGQGGAYNGPKYGPAAKETPHDAYDSSFSCPPGPVLFEFIDTCLATLKRYLLLYILVGGLVFSTVFVWIPKAFFYLTTTPAERAAIAKVETIKKEISVKEAKIRRMERELRLQEELRRSNVPRRN